MTIKPGDTFGRLSVLSVLPTAVSHVLCKCACGRLVNTTVIRLTSGSMRSCGCEDKPKTKRVGKKQFSWQGTKGAK